MECSRNLRQKVLLSNVSFGKPQNCVNYKQDGMDLTTLLFHRTRFLWMGSVDRKVCEMRRQTMNYFMQISKSAFHASWVMMHCYQRNPLNLRLMSVGEGCFTNFTSVLYSLVGGLGAQSMIHRSTRHFCTWLKLKCFKSLGILLHRQVDLFIYEPPSRIPFGLNSSPSLHKQDQLTSFWRLWKTSFWFWLSRHRRRNLQSTTRTACKFQLALLELSYRGGRSRRSNGVPWRGTGRFLESRRDDAVDKGKSVATPDKIRPASAYQCWILFGCPNRQQFTGVDED